MAPGRSFDPEGVEQALRCLPEFELKGLFRRSSNYTFLAELRGQVGMEDSSLLAVYKPAEGESPLWDFPAGTLYRREVAAYLLAKFLGWPRVPPTVIRETAPHGVGALQLFVEARPRDHYLVSQGQSRETWFQVALFDVITNNADRKSGHCLTDAERRVWVIDHGLTFHVDPKLRTVIWDFAGQQLPGTLRRDLERAAASLDGGDLRATLGELLTPREMATLRRRTRTAAASGWEMPHPSSAWSVPWPPV
jgi:uncharacterized repeat protein (TIGR03843 family)